MGLTELWIELGDTADSPHIIQGKDSRISPVAVSYTHLTLPTKA